MEFRQLTLLKIYTAEDVVYNEKPFYKAVLEEARRLKLAGGTLSRAEQGYATETRGTGGVVQNFFGGVPNLPIIIEIVDNKEHIELLFPFLEKAGDKHFLAVTTEVTALQTKYVVENKLRLEEARK